jgi:hypothetical protein
VQLIAVVADALLLPDVGSDVAVETLATFVTVVPWASESTFHFDAMTFVWPAASVPREQGKEVVQAPLFALKESTDGAGSLTTTFAAGEGPLFVTVIVYVIVPPAEAVDGPLLAIETSALPVMVVDSLSLLFDVGASPVADDAVAVSVIVPPAPACAATLRR